VVTPNTAPRAPWYLPRSRSGMTSAINAVAVTSSPPPPMPCTARNTISPAMFVARPHNIDPMTKIPALSWKILLRPNRSPNFPASATLTVCARR
jgi:hypothetical protein